MVPCLLLILYSLTLVSPAISDINAEEERWDEDFLAPRASQDSYAKHRVARFMVETDKEKVHRCCVPAAPEKKKLLHFANSRPGAWCSQAAFDKLAQQHGLDVWAASPGRHVVARVPPTVLLEALPASRYELLHPNLETALIAERSVVAGKGYHGSYHSYQEIQDRLQALARKHAAFASLETVGHSGQGRAITVFHVHAAAPHRNTAPIIYIQAQP